MIPPADGGTSTQRDFIAIQEPLWNSLNGATHHSAQAKNDFHIVFDAQKKEARRPTVSLYVNKRIP